MFFKFATFGPFLLERKSGHVAESDLKSLWGRVDADPHDGLTQAIGIYIFATANTSGSLVPWYVGKTDAGFKKRLDKHWKLFATLAEKAPEGDLRLFLIARITPTTAKFRKSGKNKLASIDDLESMMIGSCLSKNPEVANEKKKAWHNGLYVPGYYGDEKTDKRDGAALALRSMLKNAR